MKAIIIIVAIPVLLLVFFGTVCMIAAITQGIVQGVIWMLTAHWIVSLCVGVFSMDYFFNYWYSSSG
jgi:hypothetical protein